MKLEVKTGVILLIVFLFLPYFAWSEVVVAREASDPDPFRVSFGGFVDTYYGYDFNHPLSVDRTLSTGAVFGTSFVRSNEFNINLAFIEAKIINERIRGRVAFQTGTSVQANYSSENNGIGLIKGPLPSELIQEATVGYRISQPLWIDAGIYFSHIGFESFISRDNWTYTRSLMADFSPYYQAGAKLTYAFSSHWSAQIHLLNGWQTIANVSPSKAWGTQIAYIPHEKLKFTYNTFLGEQPNSQSRTFHDLVLKLTINESWEGAASFDLGTQTRPNSAGTSLWYAGALFSHHQLTSTLTGTIRLEEYVDEDQVIVTTQTPDGFVVTGLSFNADLQLHKNLIWRNEVRALIATHSVFGSSVGPLASDKFAVTSLGLSF